jgi:lysine 2-monooxygenase
MNTSSPTNIVETCDILIVGAGMSGLFAAWRLLNHDPTQKIIIVDKLPRIGGRLDTTVVNIPGLDGNPYAVKDEEGGMRFVPEGQGMENLWKLLDTFTTRNNPSFGVVPFPMGSGFNRYMMRASSFTKNLNPTDPNSPPNNAMWQQLYNLTPAETAMLPPINILNKVMTEIMNQNNLTEIPNTPALWIDFRNNCTYKDDKGTKIPLNQWGFWALLRQNSPNRKALSNECIEMLSRVIGFMGPFEEYINAGDGLQIIFDFPAAAAFFTIDKGYQALPEALAADIKKLGGKIYLSEAVDSIGNQNNRNITYTTFKTIISNSTILAVPKKALKAISKNSVLIAMNQSFMTAVDSVHDMELTKVDLFFQERWWHKNKNINLSNGGNFTDLPMGTVYSFSQFPYDPSNKNDPNKAKDDAYVGPAALTLYTDFIRGNFWKEMQNIGKSYQTPLFPTNPPNSFAASTSLVNEVMRQIKLVFGLKEDDNTIPMPVLSAYRVWGQGDFGYGYHQYKINVNDLDVYLSVYNPCDNVYVCNEAWSPEQGWVEGSLLSTDLVLMIGYGLPEFTNMSKEFKDIVSSHAHS